MTTMDFQDGQAVRDRGTTMMELLIAIVVIGIIAGTLLSVVATFLRNDVAASERIDESRDLQQITSYLPADVSSAFVTELLADSNGDPTYYDANDPATAATCSGFSTPGANVLSLKWSETFGGSMTQYRVQYRTQVVGSETQIVRVSCSGNPLSAATARTVARQLSPSVPVLTTISPAGLIQMTLTAKSGRKLTITVTPQNPNAELEHTSDFD